MGAREHGTHAKYVLDRCRCDRCRAANAAYERQRIRKRAMGQPSPYVDAEIVREHVRMLSEHGIGYREVAREVGCSRSTMNAVLYGKHRGSRGIKPKKWVRREIAEKILALDPETFPRRFRTNWATRNRLKALASMGWSRRDISRMTGLSVATQTRAIVTARPVSGTTEEIVRDVFEKLWSTNGPSPHAAKVARGKGWPMPMDLDDEGLVEEVDAMSATEYWSEEFRFLREVCGLDDQQIIATTGMTERHYMRIRKEIAA